MAMATRVGEVISSVSLVVAGSTQISRQQVGQAGSVKVQGYGAAAAGKRRPGVMMAVSAQHQSADESESSMKRTLMSTAMALAGAVIVAGSVAGNAEAALQKVEGTERGEQDAVTTGIRESSRLSAAKGNTVQEGAKTNTQASGGTILGVPKLEVPGGAYRSPQSGTYTTDEAGGKRSTPAGILQGESAGQSGTVGSAESAEVGGDAK